MRYALTGLDAAGAEFVREFLSDSCPMLGTRNSSKNGGWRWSRRWAVEGVKPRPWPV